jgi:hypothetical protein
LFDARFDNTTAAERFSVNSDLGGECITLKRTGNVGIGTNNPAQKLNIVSSSGNNTTVAKFTETANATNSTAFIALQTGYPQTSETEGLVRLGVQRDGNGNSAFMVFETSVGNSTQRRATLTNGGLTSDFILLSGTNNHQIRNYVDAQKYFDIEGRLDSLSYNGTSIGLASLPGYGVSVYLYLGGKQPILPSGWIGTITAVANANASSYNSSVYLQTSTDGVTWTTRDNTSGNTGKTLTWSPASDSQTPLFVRFLLNQGSGGSVPESGCRISNIIITNLYSRPFGFGLSNVYNNDPSDKLKTNACPVAENAFGALTIT